MTTGDDGWARLPDASSLIGYEVEAFDGKVGTVDESTVAGGDHLVVQSGWWRFGRKRMIPLDTIEAVMPDVRRLAVTLTKDDVKHAPIVHAVEWAPATTYRATDEDRRNQS